jgi:hypothetical protein
VEDESRVFEINEVLLIASASSEAAQVVKILAPDLILLSRVLDHNVAGRPIVVFSTDLPTH